MKKLRPSVDKNNRRVTNAAVPGKAMEDTPVKLKVALVAPRVTNVGVE